MFRTLIVNEVTKTALDLRFVTVIVLFGVLLVPGVYVDRRDGERRLADYPREHRGYHRQYGGQVGAEGPAEGLPHPRPLPIFAAGLDQRARQLYNPCGEELGGDLKGKSSQPRNEIKKQANDRWDQEVVASDR